MIRYLLPLVLPFFISYGLARLAWPPAAWMKKKFRLPEGIGAGGTLVVYGLLGGGILMWLGGIAGKQLAELAEQLPGYLSQGKACVVWMLEQAIRLLRADSFPASEAAAWACELADGLFASTGEWLGNAALEKAAGGLIPLLGWAGNLFAAGTTAFVSAIFYITERERIRSWMQESVFRREIRVVSRRLGGLARAFLKSQGIIFLLVAVICTFGLFLLGNNYFLLLGIAIAVLDVLPVFGTGTVLIPWTLICLLFGSWKKACGLILIYLITYYLREFLEAHMMGRELGIGSLEMMIAMYAGLKLFGIGGLFLGPIGWILIKEIDKTLYSEYNNNRLTAKTPS